MDPEKKLEILREWLFLKIDGNVSPHLKHFDNYIHQYYSHLIPGTIKWAKNKATHCFYCKKPFSQHRIQIGDTHDPLMMTVDHFQPISSKVKTTKFVICHKICNSFKGDTSATEYVRKITEACIHNKQLFGLDGHSLKTLFDQVSIIHNDILLNTGPRVYFLQLEERKPDPNIVYGRQLKNLTPLKPQHYSHGKL